MANELKDVTPTNTNMKIRKRNGTLEPVDLNKIVTAITRNSAGLESVDPLKVAMKTISGLYDGATTQELDNLSIQTCASLIADEPEYSKLAARTLSNYIHKEVSNQEIHSFSQSISTLQAEDMLNDRFIEFVNANKRKLNNAIDDTKDELFEFFGIKTVYDRYLLRHPRTRQVIETPQYFLMRVACALSQDVTEAIELYKLLSNHEYIHATPTLFNAGRKHEQMSSCYLLAPPRDSIDGIYSLFKDSAFLSKYAGGIGAPWHSIRSFGSHIKGTNGQSSGLIPWLKIYDASINAVNQAGLRRGSAAVYLEPWHPEIEEFLELRDNTGDHARRTHNLNLALWIPDLFMERVEQDGDWCLFDPADINDDKLSDLYGDAFNIAYKMHERLGTAKKTVKARDLYSKMMKTLAETGNGWMNFKDAFNSKSNQTLLPNHIIHSSNLCTEIGEVSRTTTDGDAGETAVCNLASINLGRYVHDGAFDYGRLRKVVKVAIRHLDRVIDINYYPIESAENSNKQWRPVGLGIMGIQDVFFKLRLPFDSKEALEVSTKIQEEIYYAALSSSAELAERLGKFPKWEESRTKDGVLQFDLWGKIPTDTARWDRLKDRIRVVGLRNSLLIAPPPTATIGSILGAYECIEPQTSNLFKRETLSGEFLQINRYLVEDLKKINLWNDDTKTKIKLAEGSIQGIEEIPADIRLLYRTAWELSMKSIVDLAAARGPYIDQSQSMNLFMESPSIGKLSSLYMYIWKSGLKSSYYLRSRPATKINKTTVQAAPKQMQLPFTPEEAVTCSLENPEACIACQ